MRCTITKDLELQQLRKWLFSQPKVVILELTPFELRVPVIVKSKRSGNDIFDDFFNDSFFGRTETIEHIAKSNKLTIRVDPLPSKNVPKIIYWCCRQI